MTDEELINIYDTAYKVEFDNNFQLTNQFYDQARDKKYAVQLGLGIVSLLFGFRNACKLEKEITETFTHTFKLGGSIADTIRAIPSVIEQYKIEEEERKKNHKNDISIEFKKFLGFIPYGIKQVNLKGALRIGSAFEHLSMDNEIAVELAKQRAIIDLHEQLKAKYIELGGLSDLTESELKENKLLPIEFQTLLDLKTALASNDLDKFFKIIQGVFATMSYDMKITEGYFHSHIHLVLTLLDFKIESEIETNEGRIDSVIETKNYIHIVEFKQNDSSIAINQILTKKYYQKYFIKQKKVILVGVAVDKEKRNILDWQMQTYK